ncbi:MAG: hypothetical protein LBQ74_03790 [Prevotella sp.]|nr:hypothetical protein [Prevotella sp.]
MSDFAKFYALLKQLPHADKETVIKSYSGDETTSLREFKKRNPRGFSWMLTDMENKISNIRQNTPEKSKNEPQKRRFRSLILRAMQEQGVTVKNRDWSDVNNFVEKYAGTGKSLSNMSLDELKKFNAQVHKLLDWHNMKREVNLRAAFMN